MNRFGLWSRLQQWGQERLANIRFNARALIGWVLIGLGLLGLILPVLPGVLLIVIGCGLAGKRYAWVDRLSAPLYQALAALPVEKLHPALQSLRIQPPPPDQHAGDEKKSGNQREVISARDMNDREAKRYGEQVKRDANL